MNHPDSTAADAGGALAEELQRLRCAETEGKFFDCVTDNIGTIIEALRSKAINDDYTLPCDVKLPPATKISKGCKLSTLMTALKVREKDSLFCPHFAPEVALRPTLPAAGEVREALQHLYNEVAGVWSAFDHEIRYSISNTNYSSVERRLDEAKAALAPQSKEAGEKRDLKEEMMDCYQFGIVDPASPVPQGEDIDPADVWDDYCEETPEDSRSLQGALAFGFHAVSATPTGVAPVASGGAVKPTDDELAGWARNWHWNDTAQDRPVDPSIYFRDMRMLKAFITKFSVAADATAGALREALEYITQRANQYGTDESGALDIIYEIDRIARAALASSDRE